MPTTVQADQVYSVDQLKLDGQTGARLNSAKGPVEVVGQDVKIVGQDGAGAAGHVTLDAVGSVKLAGRKVKVTAQRVDLLAEAVLLKGVHEDPDQTQLVVGAPMMWFRSDLKKLRLWDGSAIKTVVLK